MQAVWAKLPAIILCYDSANLFTFELFSELQIVRVLETALANWKWPQHDVFLIASMLLLATKQLTKVIDAVAIQLDCPADDR